MKRSKSSSTTDAVETRGSILVIRLRRGRLSPRQKAFTKKARLAVRVHLKAADGAPETFSAISKAVALLLKCADWEIHHAIGQLHTERIIAKVAGGLVLNGCEVKGGGK